MYDFDYVRPHSLTEAAELLKGDGAQPLAGGQTLLPSLRQRLARASTLVDLSRVAGLAGITREGDVVRIGAMTTHAAVGTSGLVAGAIPALSALASQIGDPQVRHRGTIGGSLANNDPAADWPAAALALAASVETNRRRISADDYFSGLFQTALEAGEIITAVHFPVPEKAGYAKFEQRASRFALVGVFVAKVSDGVRVAVTGAGDSGVFRAASLEAGLTVSFAASAIAGAKMSEDNLLSDLHAGARYRAALIPVMAERAVEAAG